MLESRKKLHELLVRLSGLSNVYFQPPESIKMEYPCIVYSRTSINTSYADDVPYMANDVYMVTYIDFDPDSEVPGILSLQRGFSFDRHFTSDGLHHNVFTATVY